MLMSFYSLLGVLGVAYLGYLYQGPVASLIAATIVCFLPDYFIPSRAVMGEVPAIGLATFAVAIIEYYRRFGGRLVVLMAGFMLSATISMKALPVFTPILLGVIILGKYLLPLNLTDPWSLLKQNIKPLLIDTMLALVGFSTLLIIPLFFYDFAAFYEQVIGMRFASRVDFAPELLPAPVSRLILDFTKQNLSLALLAFYGLLIFLSEWKKYWFLGLWLGSSWLTLLVHIPLRPKHLPMLIPPFAVLGSIAVVYLSIYFFQTAWWRLINLQRIATFSGTLLLVSSSILAFPNVLAQNQGNLVEINRKGGQKNAILRASLMTSPQDCVVSDQPVLLFQTGRTTPPELSEVSITRITTGYLTTADLTSLIEKYDCQVVIVVTERFEELLPGLQTWLANHYLLLFDERWQDTYAVKKDTQQSPQYSINQSFQNGLVLTGLDLGRQDTRSPSTTPVMEMGYISFYWQYQTSPQTLQKTFVHFRNEANETLLQIDQFPFNGQLSPQQLPTGTTIKETIWFEIPEQMQGQTTTLFMGQYNPETLERIPVIADQSGENAIVLPNIQLR
jgi:hypothetical protein